MKKENIDVLINNAGYGDFGNFTETDLNNELSMINTNIIAVHILTKSILKDMEKEKFRLYFKCSFIRSFSTRATNGYILCY